MLLRYHKNGPLFTQFVCVFMQLSPPAPPELKSFAPSFFTVLLLFDWIGVHTHCVMSLNDLKLDSHSKKGESFVISQSLWHISPNRTAAHRVNHNHHQHIIHLPSRLFQSLSLSICFCRWSRRRRCLAFSSSSFLSSPFQSESFNLI